MERLEKVVAASLNLRPVGGKGITKEVVEELLRESCEAVYIDLDIQAYANSQGYEINHWRDRKGTIFLDSDGKEIDANPEMKKKFSQWLSNQSLKHITEEERYIAGALGTTPHNYTYDRVWLLQKPHFHQVKDMLKLQYIGEVGIVLNSSYPNVVPFEKSEQ